MGFPILLRRHLYIESGPGTLVGWTVVSYFQHVFCLAKKYSKTSQIEEPKDQGHFENKTSNFALTTVTVIKQRLYIKQLEFKFH